MPTPPPPEVGAKFLGALFETGYIFPIIKTIEVVAGLALLAGVFVPLALLLLAPIVVNIVLYHLILAPAGAPLVILILVLQLVVAYSYKEKFASVLEVK